MTEPFVLSVELVRDRYRNQMRVEPCACGGVITAHVNDDAIRAAVVGHQLTARHKAWRLAAAERDAKLISVPVPDELLMRGRRCPCGGEK